MKLLRILRDSENRLIYADFRKALVLSEGRMPSSKEAYEAVSGSSLDRRVPLWTPVWTRSIVAYPAADTPFGAALEYEDPRGVVCVLDTRPFKGERNIALVLDSYSFRDYSGKVVIEAEGEAKIVRDFPQKPGHSRLFGADKDTSLPVSWGPGRLALWRNPHASIVPAVWAVYGSNTPAAWLRYGISGEFAVLTEPRSGSS